MGEVKEVSTGYGRNYLLPRRLALIATPASLKEAGLQVQKEKERQRVFAAELAERARQLEGTTLTFKEKVVAEDRLYGSVRNVHVAQELTRLTGFDVDKSSVQLEEPIDRVGSYDIIVKLGKDVTATIKVVVEAEEEDGEQQQREAAAP